MKQLNALHASLNAPTTMAVALESETIAMEGFIDSVKARWNAFKESVRPNDHEGIVQHLALIPKIKQDLAKIKSMVSNSGDADTTNITKKINQITAKLPVTATTSRQVIVELEKHRRALEVVGRKAQQANTPEKVKEVRVALKNLKEKTGKVNPDMVWTKDEALKLIDELVRYFDTTQAVGKLYIEAYAKAKRENPQAVMESVTNPIAMEHMEDILSVSMESFLGALGGLLLLFGSLLVYLFSILLVIKGIMLLLTGNFVPGVLGMVAGSYLRAYGQHLLEKSTDLIEKNV